MIQNLESAEIKLFALTMLRLALKESVERIEWKKECDQTFS